MTMKCIASWESRSGKWYIHLWKLATPNGYSYDARGAGGNFEAGTDAEAIANIETHHVETRRHQPDSIKPPMKRINKRESGWL
jgi:hypothetical protein